VVAIGNFDGVHLGHRRIVRRAAEVACREGVRAVAITFEPSPIAVLRPGTEPPRLMGLQEKLAALRQAGVDDVVVLEPTQELLSMTAERFVRKLVEERHPVAIVEGADFRFGKDRGGDNELLRKLGSQMGFETHVVEKQDVALSDQLLAPVSSSLIRWLLGQGRVSDAARCLGQMYTLTGRVVRGERRGRELGVPTVNLDPAQLQGRMIPGDGVYAGEAELHDGSRRAAAISVGSHPTFPNGRRTVEAHLLDFDGDLYGQAVAVRFARWLRDQRPFPGVESLRQQIRRDVERVWEWRRLGMVDPARELCATPLAAGSTPAPGSSLG
jgi:riboflavin kinase/FMN adenylyltransferase